MLIALLMCFFRIMLSSCHFFHLSQLIYLFIHLEQILFLMQDCLCSDDGLPLSVKKGLCLRGENLCRRI